MKTYWESGVSFQGFGHYFSKHIFMQPLGSTTKIFFGHDPVTWLGSVEVERPKFDNYVVLITSVRP